MPAIRDFATNYTTSTTGTTITIPMPAYQENDLLVAVLCADTGTGTWSLTGWTALFHQTNTSQLAVLYKIASTSESDPTFTRTVQETFNGSVISVRDINTTNPFGSTPVYTATNQAAAAKYTMSTITTTVANSLILYAVSNAVAGVPSLIEGPVILLYGQDGSAESSGVGWGFMPATGTTPNNVTCSNVATGAGVKATIQIAAPSGGATIIPAYCPDDTSVYINPINGTTAYNGNAALAATADTLFGTSLNGTTVADATVAAAADYGLNPYHSTGRLTSISGSKNWAGAALDLSAGNNVDVSSKNILVHTGPSTPGQIQRLSPVADFKGICFGMLSSAGNYKVWQVHGAGTTYNFDRDVPLVINSDNTSGLMESTGTFNPAAADVFGFWVAGSGVSTTIWDFYSLWMLDTVTVAGGNAAEPVGIPGMVSAASVGHERKSLLQQGDNQVLVLGPVQFGNGGTNPIYLDLNATAIEFPRQYNFASKTVNYCSVDNVAGLTYYAGAGDTIKHRNSVVSSASKFHWKFHASSSTSAAYDFSGLQIIGAGTITLLNNLSLSGVTWSNCSNFNSAGSYLNNCAISATTSTSALTVSSTANMGRITNTSFTNNHNGDIGHSIELTTVGTYTFDNITFSGGGVAKRNFNTGTGVNSSTDIATTDAAHGYTDGDAIYYQDQGGAQNIGLTDGALYYVNSQTATTLSFHTTKADAIADTSRVNLTSVGSETHYIYSAKADVYNNSGGVITINVLSGGSTPTIRESNSSSTIINNAVNLTVTVKDEAGAIVQNARVAMYKTSDSLEIMNALTNASGIVSTTYNYTTDTPIIVRVRKSSTGTKYIPVNATGTIQSSGFNLTVTFIADSVAT
ncbi:hypothetical protein A3F32_01890 [Candidatus Roizmanbacteria bacterium RIFCSPHIGHO2_12_FULL_42_10]|uniref:Uncharacterized protein n=2 Tax=Candidatus Roizmaniibacteriota TaxID=1752723 RepID=A0A1F7I5L0_9BACT|nr:MAG: hypothetical protein A3D08_00850 [Candidatus Roizmanbacteria bacterium RIFCSPHIGHO2_02_FULL_43_11]OGK38542.1 MAG: hypothetical protein A3F32_01890 [Candidatus Roizmanbacteria bacterium RIFCSPHIGHO2_12_FULL_42_10]